MVSIEQLVIELPYTYTAVELMLDIGFSPDQIRGAAESGLLWTPIIYTNMVVASQTDTIDNFISDHVSYIRRMQRRGSAFKGR